MTEKQVVKEGAFSVSVTRPDGTPEDFPKTLRKMEVVGGNIVITNKVSGTVTVLPPGSKATTG